VREGDYSKNISQVIEIWKGRYKGKVITIKVFKVTPRDPHASTFKTVSVPRDPWQEIIRHSDILQRMHEVIRSVKKYKDDNIVPLYGMSTAIAPFCLVYPWYKNGNIMNYLEDNPEDNRFDLASVFQKALYS